MTGPSKFQMKMPMMLASTRRRIFASRSATSPYRRAFSSAIAACEARQLQHRDPRGREHMRRETVFEVQDADQLGLFQQRQAKQRACLFAADVFIFWRTRSAPRASSRITWLCVRTTLSRASTGRSDDLTGVPRRRTLTPSRPLPASASIRHWPSCRRISRPRSAPACSTAMTINVSISFSEDYLPGHGFRHLDDRGEIELLDRCLDGRLRRGRRPRSDARMAAVELRDLGRGAPSGVALARLVQMDVCHLVEPVKAEEQRRQFGGEGLVLKETALRGQADGPVVEPHGLNVACPSRHRPFRRDQGVLVRERRRAAFRQPRKRREVSDQVFAKLSLSLRWRRAKDRRDGERMIEAVVHRLKIETSGPEHRLRLGGEREGLLRVPHENVPLQLQDPVEAGDEGDAASQHPRFQRSLVERRVAARRRSRKLWTKLSGCSGMTSWPDLYLR